MRTHLDVLPNSLVVKMLREAKQAMRSLVAPATGWFSIPLLIYLFFLSISLLGVSLKMLGGGVVTELLSLT